MPRKSIDYGQYIGRRVGMLVSHEVASDRKRSGYICTCDCGRTVFVRADRFIGGISKSCGCSQHALKTPDMIGRRCGRLVVIERAASRKAGNGVASYWKCLCDCGKEVVRHGGNLRAAGSHASCGCSAGKWKVVHGRKNSKEYQCWSNMKRRCYEPTNNSYSNYGGRGICVCDRWRNSFALFLEDMGVAPSKSHTIERNDVNSNYCPENCRWADRAEQAMNKTTNRFIEFGGRRMCLTEWAKAVGVSTGAMQGRLRRGWSIELALTTPANGKR